MISNNSLHYVQSVGIIIMQNATAADQDVSGQHDYSYCDEGFME